jgi:hypothetical protein
MGSSFDGSSRSALSLIEESSIYVRLSCTPYLLLVSPTNSRMILAKAPWKLFTIA